MRYALAAPGIISANNYLSLVWGKGAFPSPALAKLRLPHSLPPSKGQPSLLLAGSQSASLVTILVTIDFINAAFIEQ